MRVVLVHISRHDPEFVVKQEVLNRGCIDNVLLDTVVPSFSDVRIAGLDHEREVDVGLWLNMMKLNSTRVVNLANVSFWKSDDVLEDEDGAVL